MKANIHPEYKDITVTCSCGHKFVTGSALGKDLHIEVCNECHPFYTGKQKIMDTAGRVERFKGKFGAFSLKGKQEGEQTEEAPAKQAQAQPKVQAQPKAAPQAKAAKGGDKSAKSSGKSEKSAGKSDDKKSK